MNKPTPLLRSRLWLHRRSVKFKLISGYTICMALGCLLLCMPFAQSQKTSIIDSLFIAVSSVSTTGLASVSPADNFTFWGELIILLLIQLGGIGYMTFGSVIVLAIRHHISRHQQALIHASFSLPPEFDITRFIKLVIVFTLSAELIGALLLWLFFYQHDVNSAFWQAVFHSVSAFCTAGFALFNNSFESFKGHWGINLVIMILSLLGSIGFIVISDVWLRLTQQKPFGLTTKIVVRFTLGLLITGFLLVLLFDSSIKEEPLSTQILIALFQIVSAMTTVGFNTYPIAALSTASIFLIVIIMIIGASPSGTGGGVKSTTLSVLWAAMLSLLKNRRNISLFGHILPGPLLRIAVSVLGFYLLTLAIGGYALLVVENKDFEKIVFEAASALGTVGLSLGVTSDLSPLGKCIVIALMWVGRIGPLTLSIALFHISKHSDKDGDENPTEIAL